MLPDEMEAEKNRKIIVSLSNQIEILKQNVNDLQGQLQSAYRHIDELNQQWLMDYNTEGKLEALAQQPPDLIGDQGGECTG